MQKIAKLNVPEVHEPKVLNKYKVMYFCDSGFTIMATNEAERKCTEPIEEDYRLSIETITKQHGFIFAKESLNLTTYRIYAEKYFDILFFDWGGMSIGNSMLEHFCADILKHAQEHPNRFYVMASDFTSFAMEDALRELDDKPANMFLSVEDFAEYFSKTEAA